MAKSEMNGKTSRQVESKIPVLSPAPLRRSGSLRLGSCPPIKEHKSHVNFTTRLNRHRSLQSLNTASSFNCEQDDDLDSVNSFSSTASVCSNLSQCDHASFARNGTTFSGRCKRYVVHCSPHSTETDDYLTPTQRTNRTIRKLRNLLKEAQEELAEKDKEILRLSKEVVELRLLKVDSGAEVDEDTTDHPRGAEPPCETRPSHFSSSPHPRYCSSPPLAQSLSDSGHFEDLNSSKEVSQSVQAPVNQTRTLESIQRQHEDEIRELKERHNDKVDSLLQRITDVNDRYYALRPLYEDCKEKLHELEKQNEELKNGTCQAYTKKIADLETANEELSQNKLLLKAEVDQLNVMIAELKENKINHDKLQLENIQLKNKEEELTKIIAKLEEKSVNISNNTSEISHGFDQIGDLQIKHQCNGYSSENENGHSNCDQRDLFSYKLENGELKQQVAACSERIKQLEEQQLKEKYIYEQLYKKGIQAAKLQDNEDAVSGQNEESENTIIPDLLQKLKTNQEELDRLKSMYNQLLESKKEPPKNDPEMTLEFLKSAFYYFMTDRENAQGHLTAIQSILGFTDSQKTNIERAFLWR